MESIDAIKIGSKSKIHIHWRISPYDYSKEKENSIIYQASKKYSIPKDRIKLIPEFIVLNKKGEEISIAHEVVQNIQRPDFQVKLFKRYLKDNDIKGFDFDLISQIDSEINAYINYDVYDKYKKYKIKWIKWKNFLSYGDDNFFDFSNLNGLVLLNGEPANQSGKTTFAIDLTHFLFFGKIEKYPTQDKIFNKHLNEATEVIVEGCIEIEGADYIIKRKLSRPSAARRSAKSKTNQKVEYYKVAIDGSLTELEDFVDNQQEENSIQTNKVIKEAIGNEDDFDMIVCATSKNLDELIDKRDTERGRILSRWIGLLPIEEKEIIAKEKYNKEVKPYLLSAKYNKEELQHEIESYKINIHSLNGSISTLKEKVSGISSEIEQLENIRKTLLTSKMQVDEKLLKVDRVTLEGQIKSTVEKGKLKKAELEKIENELKELNNVSFSIEEFNELQKNKDKLVSEIAECKTKCYTLQKLIKDLQTSEYCPTCGRKYENIDNSAKITENTSLLASEIEKGKGLRETLVEIEKHLEDLKTAQEQYLRKCRLEAQKGAVEVSVEQCRNSYIEYARIMAEYKKNNEVIDRNNKLDIEINNNEAILQGKRKELEVANTNIINIGHDITAYEKCITEREEIIVNLEKEAIQIYNWKLYLEMIGKNGISKMVLRQVIPVINAQISALLNEICDFNVEMNITDKNDVVFYLVKDGVKSDLAGGSGFERTAAALALRSVLGNISTLPRMSCLVLDEIWGRVAKENYENLRKLLEEIGKNFDFILIISHLDEVKDFCNTIITVTKKDNVSSLRQTENIATK